LRRQCELLSVTRSNLYYKRIARIGEAELCQEICEIYERYPFYGYRRITSILRRKSIIANKKKVASLMNLQGLKAIYPGPNTSKRNHAEMVHPYLLKNLVVTRIQQVWQIDITYLRVEKGFVYLIALIDVYSRLVVSWSLSNDLCVEACIDTLQSGIEKYGLPEIVNSDQGAQFTSESWLGLLKEQTILISMTGKGRSNDNAYIERLWRSLKYEQIYLHDYKTIKELKKELPRIIAWYNFERPHQALNYLTPGEKAKAGVFMDKVASNLPTTTQLLQQQSFY
jgi:putative transposase